MFNKILKLSILLLILNIKPVYSKISNNNDFKAKNLSNYFSALVSLENQDTKESLKFFNSSKYLIQFHQPYLRKFINSLVQEGKIKQAANEIKVISNKRNIEFFEGYLILFLDSLGKDDLVKSKKVLNQLKSLKDMDNFEKVIAQSLSDFFYVFENKKKKTNKQRSR